MTSLRDGLRGPEDARAETLSAILDKVPDMVFVLDRDGSPVYANLATERITGYSLEEWMELDHFDLVHPDDVEAIREGLNKLTEQGAVSINVQHRTRGRSGDWIWMEVACTNLLDDPAIRGIFGIVRDITERKAIEEALRIEAAQDAFRITLSDALRPLSDALEIQSVAARELGKFLGVSRLHYGEVRDELYVHVEDDYVDGVPHLTGDFLMSDFGPPVVASLKQGKSLVMNDLSKSPQLSAEECETNASLGIRAQMGVPLVKDGKLVAVMSVHQSTPRQWTDREAALVEETAERTWAAVERARAEEALNESEQKYRTLFDSIDEGFFIVERIPGMTVDFCILAANLKARQTFDNRRIVGESMREVFPDELEECFESYEEVLVSGVPFRTERTVVTYGLTVDLRVARIEDSTRSRLGIVFNDITERKRAVKELSESEARFRALVNQSPLAIHVFAADGTILRSNRAWKDLWPDDDETSDTENIFGDLKILSIPGLLNDLHAGIRGERVSRGPVALDTGAGLPDDRQRWFTILVYPLNDDRQESASEITLMLQDVTEDVERMQVERRTRNREAAVKAEAAERQRISRELHDRIAHSIAVAQKSLELHAVLLDEDPERAREKLDLATTVIRNVLHQTKNLAIELRRSVADEIEHGLEAALRSLFETRFPEGIEGTLHFSGDESLVSHETGAHVYLIMREALANALRHSSCAKVELRLDIVPEVNAVVGTVRDDGEGFTERAPANSHSGIGLGSMQERAQLIGGRLDLTSEPGTGTTVSITAPLQPS